MEAGSNEDNGGTRWDAPDDGQEVPADSVPATPTPPQWVAAPASDPTAPPPPVADGAAPSPAPGTAAPAFDVATAAAGASIARPEPSKSRQTASNLGKVLLLVISLFVIYVVRINPSLMGRAWNSVRGQVGLSEMSEGQCFLMTDGPIRGSGSEGATDAEIEASFADEDAEDAYPKVDCGEWAEEDKPWQVYRVTLVTRESSQAAQCDDMTLTVTTEEDGRQTDVRYICLENLEYIGA